MGQKGEYPIQPISWTQDPRVHRGGKDSDQGNINAPEKMRQVIRVSPLHCHTVEDIDRYLEITAEMAKEFAK